MSVVITVQDTLDPSSYVCKRIRFWFRRHGLDYDEFKKNGLPVEILRATGDQKEKIDALEKTALKRIARK